MQHARNFMVALLVAAIAAFAPALALAKTTKKTTVKSSNSIVQTCQRSGDTLQGHYPLADLRKAYDSIPVAVREYTSCAQIISDKINLESPKLKAPAGGSGGGGGFPVVIVLVIVVLLVGGGGALYSYRRSRGTSEGSEE